MDNRSLTDEIRERISLEDVVSQYTQLKSSGSNKLKGKSPFTNERTPSFFVDIDKQLFYCFSSSKGGDVFTFIQEVEGLEFKDAIKLLAERAGVDISKSNFTPSSDKKDLYSVLEKAKDIFVSDIEDTHIEYLKNRGLTEETIKQWNLGFAKNDKTYLYDKLKSLEFLDDLIIKAGLYKKEEEKDVFRNRIMFPIRDANGKVVGFSGRALSEYGPKYLNSPETAVYHKSDVIFGWDFARESIRKNNFSIVTEGQFDCILSHQAGFNNTIALSGTAFSEKTIGRLSNLSKNVIIALDSDAAGLRSSLKLAYICFSLSMNVKVVDIKEGLDPADIIHNSVNDWKSMVRNARPFITHYMDYLESKTKDTSSFSNMLYEEVIPLISGIKNPIEKGNFVKSLSNKIDIDVKYIEDSLEHYEKETHNTFITPTKDEHKSGESVVEKNFDISKLQTICDAMLFLESKHEVIEEEVLQKAESLFRYFQFTKSSVEAKALIRFDIEANSDVDKVKDIFFSTFNYLIKKMLKNQLKIKTNKLESTNSKEEKELISKDIHNILEQLKSIV